MLTEVRRGMIVELSKVFQNQFRLSQSLHYILKAISDVPAD
jgi:hypothetical protein